MYLRLFTWIMIAALGLVAEGYARGRLQPSDTCARPDMSSAAETLRCLGALKTSDVVWLGRQTLHAPVALTLAQAWARERRAGFDLTAVVAPALGDQALLAESLPPVRALIVELDYRDFSRCRWNRGNLVWRDLPARMGRVPKPSEAPWLQMTAGPWPYLTQAAAHLLQFSALYRWGSEQTAPLRPPAYDPLPTACTETDMRAANGGLSLYNTLLNALARQGIPALLYMAPFAPGAYLESGIDQMTYRTVVRELKARAEARGILLIDYQGLQPLSQRYFQNMTQLNELGTTVLGEWLWIDGQNALVPPLKERHL
jgi:hypothetical protein